MGRINTASQSAALLWEEAEVSARYRLHRFDAHLRQHTIQAEKTLEMLGRPPNESKRLLRLVYAALAEAEGAALGAGGHGEERRRAAAATIAARAEEVGALLA